MNSMRITLNNKDNTLLFHNQYLAVQREVSIPTNTLLPHFSLNTWVDWGFMVFHAIVPCDL